jgi:hypothetical protein
MTSGTLESGAAAKGAEADARVDARRLGSRGRTAISLMIVAVAFALPLRGLLRSQGPPMEEGFMLVFGEMVLKGRVPNRDFLYLYGPGSLWSLAGVFKIFGTSLTVERLYGLAQQIGIVLGVFGLSRYWGRVAATTCALISCIIIVPPIGLTALPWPGAVALGVLGLLALTEMRRRGASGGATWLAPAGGVLLGVSLLFRPDLVIAVALGGYAAVRGIGAVARRRVLIGGALGVAPFLVHVVVAGPGNVVEGLLLDPVVHLRGGRRLPIPPPPDRLDGFLQRAGAIQQLHWPLPAPRVALQLTIWFFGLLLATAFLVAVGIWTARRRPLVLRSNVLLTVALFSLGLLPQAMQRVDSAHFAWVSCVTLAFLPLAVIEVMRASWPQLRMRTAALVAGGGVLAVLLFVVPAFTVRSYVDYIAQTFGEHRIAYRIEHDGRVFYYGRADVADAAAELLRAVDRVARPGDRLVVGTTDLRKTPYSDAYLYYLLPDLRPSTWYIEMDPGVANADDSKLADDIAAADIVILSSVWNDWSEPNDSRKVGSNRPNEILRRDFCPRGSFGDGLYELYIRCERGT